MVGRSSRYPWLLLVAALIADGANAPACFSADTNTRAAETWALLIGVSRYQSPHVASLRFPAADALGLRDALVDPQLGGLPRDHVRALVDDEATAAGILGAVDGFLRPNVHTGDRIVVFLAGHGVAKGAGAGARSFLLPADVRGLTTSALEATAVDLKALSGRLAQLPAAQFILFVDACREDPTPGRGIKSNALSDVFSQAATVIPSGLASSATAVTFFACDVGQRAFEDSSLQHGVFTHWILEGIRAGAVAQPPDGRVDMSRLATFVKSRVEEWARRESASGDLEIEQSPVMVATEVHGPVVLLQVRRWQRGSGAPADTDPAPAHGTLLITTVPGGAAVSLDGLRVGVSPVIATCAAGERSLRVEAAGYRTLERTIRVIDACQEQALVRLDPVLDEGSSPTGPAAQWFQRAADAENRQQWEAAEAGYAAALDADPQLWAARERLADLFTRQGRLQDAVVQLQAIVAARPRDAHANSLLARACVAFAESPLAEEAVAAKASDDGKTATAATSSGLPRTRAEARGLALRAAEAAAEADPNSAEAALAVGYALVASDRDGSSRQQALAAFGKAILREPRSAAVHCGMGTGIRYFARFAASDVQRMAELRRAIASLKAALELQPAQYEANRELAYSYHQLDESPSSRRAYQMAISYRGAAPCEEEVAGLDLAVADLFWKEAALSAGAARERCVAAAAAYLADAAEFTPRPEDASRSLSAAGVSVSPSLIEQWIAPGDAAGEAGAREAVSSPRPPAQAAPVSDPRRTGPAVDLNTFDLSGFPASPTNFEEQQVMEAIRSATIAAFKADAHERLARYYEKRGDSHRASAERAKAEYWRGADR